MDSTSPVYAAVSAQLKCITGSETCRAADEARGLTSRRTCSSDVAALLWDWRPAQGEGGQMMPQEPDTKFRINAMLVVGFVIGIILAVAIAYEFAGK